MSARSTPDQAKSIPARQAIRWWPVLVLLLLLGGFWSWVWLFEEVQRQDQNLQTMTSLLASLFFLLLWWLFLSRVSWRLRLCGAAVVAALVLTGGALFKIRGVTGDFLPVIAFRWNPGSPSTPNENRQGKSAPGRPLPDTDYPQMLGPTRDGKVVDPGLARDWSGKQPTQLWRHPVGAAWSGFAIVHRYAVTMEQRAEGEVTSCYDLLTGDPLWISAGEAHYNTTIAGEGPRTVPTVQRGSVFTLGATGLLKCLDLTNGTVRWSKNILQENNAPSPDWGVSGSPLVYDRFVIVSPGGTGGSSLVAYDAATGEVAWKAGNHSSSYSSPVLVPFGGQTQVVIFNASTVTSHAPETGQVLWDYRWEKGHPHIALPVAVSGDRLLVSSGYGYGSELLQIKRESSNHWAVARIWKSNRLKSKFANLVLHRDHIYGLDDGILTCLALETAEVKWKEGRYGHGQMILAGDLLLIMTESGHVVLVDPNPNGLQELARWPVFSDKTWNPPALAGRYLLVRNDREAVCLELPIILAGRDTDLLPAR